MLIRYRSTVPRLAGVVALFLALSSVAVAQTVTFTNRGCGTNDPTPSERFDSMIAADEWLTANRLQVSAFRSSGAAVKIPVAFHIISTGPSVGQGNAPDAWVIDQMQVLNDAFRSFGYQFVLVFQQRISNSDWSPMSDDSPEEAEMKNALALDPSRFLNIYSVPNLGQLLGWATFPRSGVETDKLQGLVLKTASMPGGGSAPYNLGDTGTHEVGHFVGLYHTFQGGCSGSGDGVADTPAVLSNNFGCPVGRDSCPDDGLGPDQVENFMDYTDDSCMDRFTQGQADRSLGLMSQFRPTLMTQSGTFASHTSLDFGLVSVGSPVTKELRIVNLSSADVAITSITSSSPAHHPNVVAGTVPAGGSFGIDVQFDPVSGAEALGVLTVVTADETIEVALSGTGFLAPGASAAVPALAASSNLEGSASGEVSFQNAGRGPLFFSFEGSFGRGIPSYQSGSSVEWISSVTPVLGLVPPSGEKTVTVALNAAGLTAGVYEDLLLMGTNDPQRPTVPFHVVFAVDGALAPPALIGPFYGEQDANPAASFSWLAATDATGYDVDVATDEAFTNVVHNEAVGTNATDVSLQPSTDYFWRVRTTTASEESPWTMPFPFSTGLVVASDRDGQANARSFALGTFYPNPTRGVVTIPFTLDGPRHDVSVRILDVTGRIVTDLGNSDSYSAGAHRLEWDSESHPAGVYIVQLRADGKIETGRIVVLR